MSFGFSDPLLLWHTRAELNFSCACEKMERVTLSLDSQLVNLSFTWLIEIVPCVHFCVNIWKICFVDRAIVEGTNLEFGICGDLRRSQVFWMQNFDWLIFWNPNFWKKAEQIFCCEQLFILNKPASWASAFTTNSNYFQNNHRHRERFAIRSSVHPFIHSFIYPFIHSFITYCPPPASELKCTPGYPF